MVHRGAEADLHECLTSQRILDALENAVTKAAAAKSGEMKERWEQQADKLRRALDSPKKGSGK